MHDALGMGIRHGVGQLGREVHGAPRVERPVGDDRRERLAGHELADDVGEIPLFADLVERRDIRMRQRSGRARILEKPRAPLGVAGHLRREHLDGDRSAQLRVAGAIQFADSRPRRSDRGSCSGLRSRAWSGENYTDSVRLKPDTTIGPAKAGHYDYDPTWPDG